MRADRLVTARDEVAPGMAADHARRHREGGVRWRGGSPYTRPDVGQRAEATVDHFRVQTAAKIGGHAKAMVVTSSPLHAVR